MDKIIYKNINVDDNWMLVAQGLIDKQAEIIDSMNTFFNIIDNLNKFNEILVKKLKENKNNG